MPAIVWECSAGHRYHVAPLPARSLYSLPIYMQKSAYCCCRCRTRSLCYYIDLHAKECVWFLQVYDEYQELTPNTVLTHFMFSLPFAECPTFSTHLMQHRWALRFEFTATYQPSGSSWGLGRGSKAPEQITWLLPILVWPPSC